MKVWSTRCNDTGCGDGGLGPWIKESGNAGKAKKIDSPLEQLERNTTLVTHDFNPVKLC